MKVFDHVKVEHVKSCSWWFWFRENVAFMNHGMKEIYHDAYHNAPHISNFKDWISIIVIIPLAYLLGFAIGPRLRRRDALDCAGPHEPGEYANIVFYHKTTIDYFTLLNMLSSYGR